MALKNAFLLLALTCLVANATATRNNIDVKMINNIKPGYNLAARLEANGGQVIECWKAFVELKLSCSNATVQYFLTGHANISHCCHAIDIITHKCWPAKLTSLGFTPKESKILIGYCGSPPPITSPPPPVVPSPPPVMSPPPPVVPSPPPPPVTSPPPPVPSPPPATSPPPPVMSPPPPPVKSPPPPVTSPPPPAVVEAPSPTVSSVSG